MPPGFLSPSTPEVVQCALCGLCTLPKDHEDEIVLRKIKNRPLKEQKEE
jgi:hypothetical protein